MKILLQHVWKPENSLHSIPSCDAAAFTSYCTSRCFFSCPAMCFCLAELNSSTSILPRPSCSSRGSFGSTGPGRSRCSGLEQPGGICCIFTRSHQGTEHFVLLLTQSKQPQVWSAEGTQSCTTTAANRESCCLPPGDLQNTASEMVHKLPNPASSLILQVMYFFLQLDLPWLSFYKVKHGNPWPY